ncbi:MAG: hypothetical protein WC758_08235 [Candidatus Woesearchaeota archaeon]|jgi:hypothetical protein
MERKRIKGQMGLGDAPTIVMIVGLVFLVMATMALIGEKYGNALDVDDTSATAINESVNPVSAGVYLSAYNKENVACGAITAIYNATNHVLISAGNYTQTGCLLQNTTSDALYPRTGWKVNYPYTYSASTVASNVTGDLETEISNNTSIAGIVLTISLIGIVLTILIGVFMGMNRKTNRI